MSTTADGSVPLEETERFFRLSSSERGEDYPFCDNSISTTKYTVATFLPKNFFEQIRRIANFYFLIIILLEYFPFSPLSPTVSVLPLVFVIGLTAAREGWEDYNRGRTDRRINRSPCYILRGNRFVKSQWADIQVGDVIYMKANDFAPADIMVLSSSGESGICYVDTCNLDGETNLKILDSIPQTLETFRVDGDVETFRYKDLEVGNYSIRCELPNSRLYNFEGKMINSETGEEISLSVKTNILRGMQLKNTKWVVGAVVFTGSDTKLMMNSKDAPSKQSSIEVSLNYKLIMIFASLLTLTFVAGVAAGIWQGTEGKQATYLRDDINEHSYETSPFLVSLTSIISFIILLNVLVPISLYVTVEFVKLFLAQFISKDPAMYDKGTYAQARTSNLSEDLGLIEYVFSDKTGTLTRNVMEFMKCSIGGKRYGTGVTEVELARRLREKIALKKMSTKKDDDLQGVGLLQGSESSHTDSYLRSSYSSSSSSESAAFNYSSNPHEVDGETEAAFQDPTFFEDKKKSKEIQTFLEILSLCHTVIIDKEGEVPVYQASSPDEGALVNAAKYLGYEFYGRTPDTITIKVHGEDGESVIRTFDILNVLEFNSTRKRMSVILREKGSDKIVLYTKGADNVIYERLSKEAQNTDVTRQHLEEFAAEGLRTLVFAYRDLDQEYYDEWNKRFTEANTSIGDRKERLAAVSEEIERELVLVGASAIEDKLQVGVPDTIEMLRKAGIKVWVLTGDKQETAINIGYACSLIDTDMELVVINKKQLDRADLVRSRDYIKRVSTEEKKEMGMVITGQALESALRDEVKKEFLEAANMCKSIICCRVSPLQKSQIVDLVRENVPGKLTLAIGDGANDVSMIQAAHIGVGISGQEGMQAVMASDYAISQFRFLKNLLFVHGRWSFRRVSLLVMYSFYKNVAMVIPNFLFAMHSAFSAMPLYDPLLMSIYNVFFTSIPVMVTSLMEQDVLAKSELKYPKLYSGGNRHKEFSMARFVYWLLQGVYHALVLFYVPYFVYKKEPFTADGQIIGFYGMSVTIYSALVVLVNVKIALETTFWTVWHHLSIWGSIIFWFVFIYMFGHSFMVSPRSYYVADKMFTEPMFYITIFLIVVICLVPDLAIKYVRENYYPLDYMIIKRREIRKARRAKKEKLIKIGGGAGGAKKEETLKMKLLSESDTVAGSSEVSETESSVPDAELLQLVRRKTFTQKSGFRELEDPDNEVTGTGYAFTYSKGSTKGIVDPKITTQGV